MPTTGTWKVRTPAAQTPTVTGGGTWTTAAGGYARILDTLSSLTGTSVWLAGDEPGLYLDGSSTPVYIADLPPGWAVDDAYTATFVATNLTLGSTIQFAFAPLGITATQSSPPDNP